MPADEPGGRSASRMPPHFFYPPKRWAAREKDGLDTQLRELQSQEREDEENHHAEKKPEDEQGGCQEEPKSERIVGGVELFPVALEFVFQGLAWPTVGRLPLETDITKRGAEFQLKGLCDFLRCARDLSPDEWHDLL